MGETFAARMAGALPVQLTNVSVDLIAKLAIDAIGGNGNPGKVATGTLIINGIAFGLDTLMHMAMTAAMHCPPVARKVGSILKSDSLPKREVLYRIAALSAVLSALGESWPVRLGGDLLMQLKMHEQITAVGTIKGAAGDIVGQLASAGVISATVYGLYKTQPAFRAQADKMVKDALAGISALRERAPGRSESTRSGERIELGSIRSRDSVRRPRR
jgi:hypothetical protein